MSFLSNNNVRQLLSEINALWFGRKPRALDCVGDGQLTSSALYCDYSVMRALEPRIMLDAALAGIIAETAFLDDSMDFLQDNIFTNETNHYSHDSKDVLNGLFEDYIPPQVSSHDNDNIVVFVDEGVDDLSAFLSNFDADIDVVVLASDRDGFRQIAQNLSNRTEVDAVHIFSHGRSGELILGDKALNSVTIGSYSDILSVIKGALSEKADLFLYGCNFAQDNQFISDLAELTGADVAASDDLTGAASLGGDWDLEIAIGEINAEVFAFENYNNVLAVLTVNDFDASITYDETDVNAGPQIIDAAVTLAGGTGVFSTYAMTVSSNGEATEKLSVNTQGYGVGEIAYNSGTGEVKYEGSAIGMVTSDGFDGADLIVHFNDNANNTSVEALIENLTYENTSDDPAAARTVTIDLNDGSIGNLVFSDTQTTGYYPGSLTFSPDGNYAYIASAVYDTIEIYSHNSITGQLTYLSQVKDGVDGVDGLDNVLNTTFSSDGNYFYAAGYNDDAVAIFSYDNTTGQLTYLSQVKDGVGGVDGLDGANNIIFSPDGNYAYVTGQNDNAVAVFSYDNTTGNLTYLSHVKDGVGGVDGLYGVRSITFSPDGDYAYAAGYTDDAVAIFSYDNTTGSLTYLSRVRDGSDGVDGLNGATQLTFSPDGNYAYVTGCNDSAVAIFSYDNTTGQLTYLSQVKDGVGGVDGLYGAMDIIFSPDGSYAYVTGYNDDAVAVFSYDNTTGNLTQIGFFKDGTVAGQKTVNGLNAVKSLTFSLDGKFIYAAGYYDHAVSIFEIAALVGENNVEFSKTVNITPVDDVLILNDQTLYAAEDMQVTDSVGTVQLVDPDGPAVTYTIMGGNADGVFAINAATGEITIADTTNLDFETTSQYVLTVDVTDGTNPDTASITININDASEAGFLVDLTQDVVFLENTVNSTAQIIDGNVTLSGGPANYSGYVLLISGPDSNNDQFNVQSTGTGVGEISVSDNNVLYEGSVIGLIVAIDTADMSIVLNSNATSAATEALIEALTYQNLSETPVLARDVNITLMLPGLDNISLSYVDIDYSNLAFADIDGDGDLDAFIGENYGTIKYYENNGAGNFAEVIGAGNPFDGVDIGSRATPSFADLDGDGDLDVFIGEDNGNINYYENDGAGNFSSVTGAGNPFDGVDIGSRATPSFADIDGDGDLDAFIGEYDGNINYYQNDGAGNFSSVTGAGNPFDGVDVGYYSNLAFADIDGDGDFDVFIGESSGTIKYYENDGAGNFAEITGAGNPLDGVDVGSSSAPAFADIDGDGDLDIFIGGYYSNGIKYYENDGAGNFSNSNYTIIPAITDDLGSNAAPVLVDIDGDGDLDAFIGEGDGNINYYENDGAGNFTEITGAGNPFDGVDVGYYSAPSFADIDGDGDLDAFIGESDGNINYYQNDGAGNFTSITGAGNPFDGVDVGSYSTPTFADINGDGNIDAFIGESYGTIFHYSNNAGTFIKVTANSNLFNGVDIGSYSTPIFADIDG
ncbi:MAG: VCBS repeat-containing protein, partial [Alphaproteobacteria bacterium]|nr:VCBS repeat-containing protein [Alphaproteobacteria bacterium]